MAIFVQQQMEKEEEEKQQKKEADERKKKAEEERAATEEANRIALERKKAKDLKEAKRIWEFEKMLAKQKEAIEEEFERRLESRLKGVMIIEKIVKAKTKQKTPSPANSDSEEEEEALHDERFDKRKRQAGQTSGGQISPAGTPAKIGRQEANEELPPRTMEECDLGEMLRGRGRVRKEGNGFPIHDSALWEVPTIAVPTAAASTAVVSTAAVSTSGFTPAVSAAEVASAARPVTACSSAANAVPTVAVPTAAASTAAASTAAASTAVVSTAAVSTAENESEEVAQDDDREERRRQGGGKGGGREGSRIGRQKIWSCISPCSFHFARENKPEEGRDDEREEGKEEDRDETNGKTTRYGGVSLHVPAEDSLHFGWEEEPEEDGGDDEREEGKEDDGEEDERKDKKIWPRKINSTLHERSGSKTSRRRKGRRDKVGGTRGGTKSMSVMSTVKEDPSSVGSSARLEDVTAGPSLQSLHEDGAQKKNQKVGLSWFSGGWKNPDADVNKGKELATGPCVIEPSRDLECGMFDDSGTCFWAGDDESWPDYYAQGGPIPTGCPRSPYGCWMMLLWNQGLRALFYLLLLLTALALVLYVLIDGTRDARHNRARYVERACMTRTALLEQEFAGQVEKVASVVSFLKTFYVSNTKAGAAVSPLALTENQFLEFTNSSKQQRPWVGKMSFAIIVNGSEREKFESANRTILNPRDYARQEVKDVYAPILYAEAEALPLYTDLYEGNLSTKVRRNVDHKGRTCGVVSNGRSDFPWSEPFRKEFARNVLLERKFLGEDPNKVSLAERTSKSTSVSLLLHADLSLLHIRAGFDQQVPVLPNGSGREGDVWREGDVYVGGLWQKEISEDPCFFSTMMKLEWCDADRRVHRSVIGELNVGKPVNLIFLVRTDERTQHHLSGLVCSLRLAIRLWVPSRDRLHCRAGLSHKGSPKGRHEASISVAHYVFRNTLVGNPTDVQELCELRRCSMILARKKASILAQTVNDRENTVMAEAIAGERACHVHSNGEARCPRNRQRFQFAEGDSRSTLVTVANCI
ncbi:hypothetical protein CBR_g4038 [Chara braunii]|uniref:Uncharacterized protein n=1 Tax=Chara braunii TaxID=69332 RepID=A0A388KH24_CHABU|nr:hypothetical protein CBR_g4038 [Chara braunii]|eukprot:GBG69341.1 hypothetical protein CBR_g4038 [Chara braunii]